MKKIMALVLAAMMLLACCSFAVAEDIPEGYPEIIEGLDFGGETVHIYQWYSTEREEDPSDAQQAVYDYQDWLMKTYNVNIVEEEVGTWDGMSAELQNIVTNKDTSKLIILGMSGSFVGPALVNHLYMPWTYGLENYQKATIDFMTVNGVCYGVCASDVYEPRQCVFFNKQVLEDANIDWNELYDLQANGEWTWDKMEEYMEKVQRDLDNDDILDVYAVTGNGDDCFEALVVSNNGDYFEFDDNGKLVYTADKDNNTLEAIARCQEWRTKYYRPNENWDDYKQFWPEGNVAFFIGQSYEGFNGNDVVNKVENWGCVCMPKGPAATEYTHVADNNIFGIPNIYDDETSLKLQQIYTLYRMPVPGQDEDSWADRLYALTDDRAVDETYAYLRKHGTLMNYRLIGDPNSILGPNLMWGPLFSCNHA